MRKLICGFLTAAVLLSCLCLPASAATRAENEAEVYQYLRNTVGCNAAVACGIMASIEAESRFIPTAEVIDVNGLTSYGLCQWNGPRYEALMAYSVDNYDTVAGQMNYLRHELLTSERSAWSKMQDIENTAEGAYAAGYRWARYFERGAEVYNGINQYEARAEKAVTVFWAKYGNGGTYTPTSGVHFPKTATYTQGQFRDVASNQWFSKDVANAVTLGLMKGNGDGTFAPTQNVTLAETITMAARIHSIYNTGAEKFKQTSGSAWYQVYLDYAYKNGIIGKTYYYANVNQKATRAQYAEILSNSLPDKALPVINKVGTNAIPDVKSNTAYANSVYRLYRAGILRGGDTLGTFFPTTNITRAESAAVVSRMAESSYRVTFTLP